ncbi:MAG: hypothetical protein QXD48_00150 [Candidatus Aenigmatarchaeota archaeon]
MDHVQERQKQSKCLRKKGYYVVREFATEIIKKQKAYGGDLFPHTKPLEFQLECLRRQLEKENKTPTTRNIFL